MMGRAEACCGAMCITLTHVWHMHGAELVRPAAELWCCCQGYLADD